MSLTSNPQPTVTNYLLVINAGSSSIKFATYQLDLSSTQLTVDVSGNIDGIGVQACFCLTNAQGEVLIDQHYSLNEVPDHAAAINLLLSWLKEYLVAGKLLAVGHRVVHGGPHFSAPVMIDAKVVQALESLIPLAPLHQAHNLKAMRALLASEPNLPQVACFDTAFHHTQSPLAKALALPRRLTDAGLRRYGFHGLSYEYIVSVLPKLDANLAKARVIIAHLGNGTSLCATKDGYSVATTMGFSPLDGLMMGTRCGSIDAGVLLYLLDHEHLDAQALQHLLYFESGLLGVSGISSDMRVLLASDDAHAQEAIDLFVYRIVREIGSLAAALGGLDALVFTGGIGEHAGLIRAQVCQQTAWLGLEFDDTANANAAARISKQTSKVSAWLVPSDENLMIARHTLAYYCQQSSEN